MRILYLWMAAILFTAQSVSAANYLAVVGAYNAAAGGGGGGDLYDTFTETGSTITLDNHTADSGSAWTLHSGPGYTNVDGSSAGTTQAIGTSKYYYPVTSSSADAKITVSAKLGNSSTSVTLAWCLRYTPSVSGGYCGLVDGGGRLGVYTIDSAGAYIGFIISQSACTDFTYNDWETIEFSVSGANPATISINCTTCTCNSGSGWSTTDSDYDNAGYPMYRAVSGSNSAKMDTVTVSSL